MIFSIGNHIQQIIKGEKTQTRRTSNRYRIGQTYAIQPRRTAEGILDGRILITDKQKETWDELITPEDAEAEGGYKPEEFEELYSKVHPDWVVRWAYTFKFIPSCPRCYSYKVVELHLLNFQCQECRYAWVEGVS